MAGWAATRTRKTSPSPLLPAWDAPPAQYGVGVHHNVAVLMSDGISLRVDIHYPTDPATGEAASGPFPVLLSMTPYGKKAPPPAAQIGGGATPYLIRRGVEWGNKPLSELLGELISADAESRRLWTLLGVL